MKILLLEDYPYDMGVTLDLLTEIGIDQGSVHCANSLEDCFQKYAGESFDLVLLNLELPDSQGIATFEKFQSRFPDPPVVVFSGLEDEKIGMAAVKQGAQDYLVKGKIQLGQLKSSIYYSIERMRLQEELIAAKNKAEEAYQSKSQFLAAISHDLSNPLNSILTLSQYLAQNREGHLDENELEIIDTILSAGSDSLDLINDLLTIACAESGNLEFQGDALAIVRFVRQMEKRFAPLIQKRGLVFEVHIDEDIPEFIYTDPHRLAQIIQNLLANSIKFTRNGNIQLRLKNEAAEMPSLSLSVSDTGIGIAEEQLERIFQAFNQGSTHISKEYGGTGLGLSIVDQLTKLLEGKVHVQSKLGQGSAFTVVLPHQHSDKSAESSQDQAVVNQPSDQALSSTMRVADLQPPLQLAGKKVLLAEDDMRTVYAMLPFLQKAQMEVIFAYNGKQALERLQETAPDVIIMDLMMPVMDGYEAIRIIRNQEHWALLPIIVSSATTAGEAREKSLDLGASAFLEKPVSIPLLLETMAEVCK